MCCTIVCSLLSYSKYMRTLQLNCKNSKLRGALYVSETCTWLSKHLADAQITHAPSVMEGKQHIVLQ